MNMYINQQIQVKWNNMLFKTCTISNGVKISKLTWLMNCKTNVHLFCMQTFEM